MPPPRPPKSEPPSEGSAAGAGEASGPFADAQGASRLAVDAVVGVTDLVEAMHRTIAGLTPPLGPPPTGPKKGIAGFVYRSIRRLAKRVGAYLSQVLTLVGRAQTRSPGPPRPVSARREAVVAILNGVVGDHLAATDNPLALAMRVHTQGRALTLDRHASRPVAVPAPTSRLVVFVHGLCMNDLQWTRKGQCRAAVLAARLGAPPLYLHYNTGRPIAANGRALADLLDRLVALWPVPVHDVVLIGHSMGGLVARSACHYGSRAGQAWRKRRTRLVFLGTPHHGSRLERIGQWVDRLADVSPYTAPLGRVGRIRSAGVNDLRDGTITDATGDGADASRGARPPAFVPLPDDVDAFAVAASRHPGPKRGAVVVDARTAARLKGDGLVTVSSALGLHDDAARSLRLPPAHRRVCYGMNHFDLLRRREVYDHVHHWLAGA